SLRADRGARTAERGSVETPYTARTSLPCPAFPRSPTIAVPEQLRVPRPASRQSMYTTCLFCHSDLGANYFLPTFPVGRRLAFDPKKGRLWVVCTRCGRWNLTPLEERWEAIDDCERLFRGTRLRMSTDNIGLARFR